MLEKRPSHSGGDYDDFVDWDARLGREAGFFKSLFEANGVQRVLDVGAGSARHSIMFASWGLEVIAVDPDDAMLAQAEANVVRFSDQVSDGGGSVRIVRGGFGGLSRLELGLVDALVCTGNALPHVVGRDGLTEALADFGSVVAPGGVIVLHLLNHARLISSHSRVVAPKIRDTDSGTKVFLRVIEYPSVGEFLDFDFLTLTRALDGEWEMTHRRSEHTAIPAELLAKELPCAGFGDIQLLGGHDGHALTDADESIIVVAKRR
ncbi:MAG: class I SAM-dependent methyltransferase [Actinomycetota bacterium]|nr:class I SAM-dependent methyltransferase [Actinomycetota bacterium]